jgi:hypothetical protein
MNEESSRSHCVLTLHILGLNEVLLSSLLILIGTMYFPLF